jgi:hypothetical protein
VLRWLWPPVALLVVALVAVQFGPDLLAWKTHRVGREYRQVVDGILRDFQPTPETVSGAGRTRKAAAASPRRA